MPRKPNSPSLRLFLSLTIGVAAIWLIAGAVGITFVESASQLESRESLSIALDGEPLLNRHVVVNGVSQLLPYKTLAGAEVPRDRELASPVQLLGSSPSRPWNSGPIDWDERLLWSEDDLRWYVVRDAELKGRAYLVGYNRETKLPSQYLSRAGLQLTPPSREDYFEVGPTFAYMGGLVTGRRLSGLQVFGSYTTLDIPAASSWRSLYFFDRDDLFELQLQTLGMQKIATIENPIVLTMTSVPDANSKTDETPQADSEPAANGDFQYGLPRRLPRLVVRTADRVLVRNPSSDEQTEYRLPPELHGVPLRAYAVTGERLVVERMEQIPTGTVSYLTWLSPTSEVLRTEEVTTNRHAASSPFEVATMLCLAAPLALLYAPAQAWIAPMGWMSVNSGMTYGVALQQVVAGSWYVSLAFLALSCVLAAFVYRWQRENNRPRPVAWTVAAFLLGVPGFIAYFLLHGRPSAARARTHKIATTEPKLLGIEIFA